jgi:hypothetical protein
MKDLKRAKVMLGIIVFGLLISGSTVWPAVPELKLAVRIAWGDGPPTGASLIFREKRGMHPYSFMINNCGTWAKRIIEGSGLQWPGGALLGLGFNLGTALGGPMDNTGIPQATYVASVVGYQAGQVIVLTGETAFKGVGALGSIVGSSVTWVIKNTELHGFGIRFAFGRES